GSSGGALLRVGVVPARTPRTYTQRGLCSSTSSESWPPRLRRYGPTPPPTGVSNSQPMILSTIQPGMTRSQDARRTGGGRHDPLRRGRRDTDRRRGDRSAAVGPDRTPKQPPPPGRHALLQTAGGQDARALRLQL